MRILHVNKFLYRRGGAESYLLDLAELQRERGDRVAFFSMRHPDNLTVPYEEHFPRHIEMNPLPRGPLGKLRGAGRMLWSRSARRGIGKVIADFEPDVAHLHNIYHQLSPSVLAALRTAGVPMVMTLHDYKLACPSYSFLDKGTPCTACVGGSLREPVKRRCKGGSLSASMAVALETWLHRRFDAYDPVHRFICPSRFMAGQLTQAEIFPDRLRILDHFADDGGSPAKTVPGGPLVCVGRLSPEKGFDVAIKALGMLRGFGELVIAGDGPERMALERMADEVAPGRVRFTGRLPKEEVLRLIQSATALLIPSRWYENQPMTILEAFACGVPVIGTTLGGIPELVVDGATGKLVPPDDPLALSSAALALLKNPQETLEMGRSCREVARRRFSPEGHYAGLREIYREAVKAANSS
ncbi:glycosyltransferase family 4 protein [Nonomuraea antimicrobica]|uniref:Glycosyltransferase family 4 protein n=1 Tax=Nonomuraea antimicrobica TaxID=561173 RepID=A0ABP7AZJ9_9ACTN